MVLFIVVAVGTLGSMYFWIRPLTDWKSAEHRVNLRYGVYATMVLIILCAAMGCTVAPDYINETLATKAITQTSVGKLLNKTAHYFDHTN